jgi:flagellar motor switch protein FliM
VKVSELEVTYGQLESLKVGQVLPLDLFEQAEVNVAGATAFHGTVGEFDGQMSVKLKEYKKEENQ